MSWKVYHEWDDFENNNLADDRSMIIAMDNASDDDVRLIVTPLAYSTERSNNRCHRVVTRTRSVRTGQPDLGAALPGAGSVVPVQSAESLACNHSSAVWSVWSLACSLVVRA